MKKIFYFMLISVFFIGTAFAESLTLCALEYPPYSTMEIDDRGQITANLRDKLRKAYDNIYFLFYRWDTAFDMAVKGKCIGYFPACIEDVDQSKFFLSKAIDKIKIGILSNNLHVISYRNYHDMMCKYKVGIIWMKKYPNQLKKHHDGMLIFNQESDLINALSTDKINLAIGDVNVLLYYADKQDIKNIFVYKIIKEKKLHIAFSRSYKNIDIAININDALK